MHDRLRKGRAALAALALLALQVLVSPRAGAEDDDSDQASPSLISPGSLNLFYDSEGPLSFVSPTPRDRPRRRVEAGEFSGESCQRGFSIPLSLSFRPMSISAAGGDGGYFKALGEIRRKNPALAGLYDIRVDVRTFSLLGIYRKTCTEILARGYF